MVVVEEIRRTKMRAPMPRCPGGDQLRESVETGGVSTGARGWPGPCTSGGTSGGTCLCQSSMPVAPMFWSGDG